VLNSGGDGLPPGVGETAPGHDSQACQSSGAALWRQSIKCPYARVGTGARGGVGKARVGALERSGPRPRGCSALERGGPRSRGGAEPSSEADPARGGVRASSEADFTRGASAVLSWRAAGPPGSWLCCVCVLGVRVDSHFAFFAGFKRVSPDYLGDPYGCPQQNSCSLRKNTSMKRKRISIGKNTLSFSPRLQ
jgi:hypothetical protein